MTNKELQNVRRRRLQQLLKELGGPNALAELTGNEANFFSQLKSEKKPFGEKLARKIEKAAGKSSGWLDLQDGDAAPPQSPVEWPFSFDRQFWDRLHPLKKRDLERSFEQMILGANIQEAAGQKAKPKTG